MPDGKGNIKPFEIDPNIPAHKNENFMRGFTHMLLVSRKEPQFRNEHELVMIQESFRRNKVTPVEAYNAFWLANQDQYVPASGIEWKHLWKYIEEMRKGRDRKLYSYREMLSICDKEDITTDHFEQNLKMFEELKKMFPRKSPKDLKCWKRL